MESYARNAESAYKDARALLDKLKGSPSGVNDALIREAEALAPAPPAEESGGRGGRGGRGGGGRAFGAPEPQGQPNLANIAAELIAAVMPLQASEMPPTALELQACNRQEAAYTALMAKWTALKAKVSGKTAPAKK
jgi:hypothetical protein